MFPRRKCVKSKSPEERKNMTYLKIFNLLEYRIFGEMEEESG